VGTELAGSEGVIVASPAGGRLSPLPPSLKSQEVCNAADRNKKTRAKMLRVKVLSFLWPSHKIGGLRRRHRSFGNYISNIRTATSPLTSKVILR
jgi:hypothetical protein